MQLGKHFWELLLSLYQPADCIVLSILSSESLLFSGNAKIDVYTSPSHYMISKPIKLTASWLKFAALPRKRLYDVENFTCKFFCDEALSF